MRKYYYHDENVWVLYLLYYYVLIIKYIEVHHRVHNRDILSHVKIIQDIP